LGIKLALITNGAAEPQRAKVVRFALEQRFDHIQIEGEHGFGKPEERAYKHAMEKLGVGPHETWMVGDNLEWKSSARSASAFTRSGTTATALACPRLPDPRPHHPPPVGIAAVAEPFRAILETEGPPPFGGAGLDDGGYLAGVRLPAFPRFSAEFSGGFFAAQILAAISREASCWAASSAGA
jgi:hypothetical protein